MLHAGRFENDDTSAALLEQFENGESIGVRWSLPGGVQRIEVTIPVTNIYDLYNRMDTHTGQRLSLYSSRSSRPIGGWIYEVNPVGYNRIKYVAYGGWRRLKDVYDTTVYSPTDTNGDVVNETLTDHCGFYNGDSDNIDLTGAVIGGWQPDDETGSLLQSIILDMVDMSDSNNAKFDFWLTDESLQSASMRQMSANFQPRSTGASIDWQVDLKDLVRLEMSRGIAERYNDVTIFYDTIGGTATGGSATTLIDSGASFTTDNLTVGDRVVNETDESYARIESIDSDTQLTISSLTGGTANTFSSSDIYSITLQDMQSVNVSATDATPWVKEWVEIKRGFNVTQATYYANQVLEQKDAVKQQVPFVIGSKYVRDGNGAEWPLWEMVAQGGGYIRINDLYPQSGLFSQSYNNATSFFITALDYDHTSGQMRVNVDTTDSRLDVRLLAAGILNSEMVGRKI